MVKRIAALALAVCMALPLFGCGGRIEAQCLTNGITIFLQAYLIFYIR